MPPVLERHSAQLPAEARRKLTREYCRALEEAGLLELERFELIDGELIRKMSKSPLHSIILFRLVKRLRAIFGYDQVTQEVSMGLGPFLSATNEPEPDVIVLRGSAEQFETTNPEPHDAVLVAEVCATSQEYDLGAKAALYASAGIAEYWVIDVRNMRIVVHRDPIGERYASIVAYGADEAVSPLAAESASIRLNDLKR